VQLYEPSKQYSTYHTVQASTALGKALVKWDIDTLLHECLGSVMSVCKYKSWQAGVCTLSLSA